jgi:hypothetical protein
MSPTARQANPIKINRVQALVLAFLLMAWLSLVVILVAAPEVYELRLQSLPGAQPVVAIVFVLALTAFIVFLSIGVPVSNCLTDIHEPITKCACDPPTDAAQLSSPGRGSKDGAVGVIASARTGGIRRRCRG